MLDSTKHQGMRKRLVDNLRNKGITDERVLKAIGQIPRHLFMDSSFVSHAYEDKAFPIAAGQTISQPYTVAFQTQLLEVNPGHRILEIGTGSGYQTAVLTLLGAEVYTIERQHSLYRYSLKQLPPRSPRRSCRRGGWPRRRRPAAPSSRRRQGSWRTSPSAAPSGSSC